jgi:hypothetical protein
MQHVRHTQDKLDTLDDANTELMMGEGDNVECVHAIGFLVAATATTTGLTPLLTLP